MKEHPQGPQALGWNNVSIVFLLLGVGVACAGLALIAEKVAFKVQALQECKVQALRSLVHCTPSGRKSIDEAMSTPVSKISSGGCLTTRQRRASKTTCYSAPL